MKILVTGGAGFIGSNLCKRLLKENHKILSLDNYFTGSKDNHIKGVKYFEGHTKDISKIIKEKVDLIYHLGEYSRVEISLEEPDIVFNLNITGTLGVLQYWKKNKCKLIYAGSSTKFGDSGLNRGETPYAWSKATNSELIKIYAGWYKLSYAITYFYNVYGPGERADKYGSLIEIFRQKFMRGEKLTVVSPGTQRRNFTHINDIIDGLILVGEKGEGDNFGIGNKDDYSILEIAKMFNTQITMIPRRKGNRMSSSIITTKTNKLGWRAQEKISDYIKIITKQKSN